MALVKCNECGKNMSDTLSNCPHCGIEINKKISIPKKENNGITLAIDIILIIVLGLISINIILNCFITDINLYDILYIINNIIYVLFLWSIFFSCKFAKDSYKLLTTINLFVYIVLYITLSFISTSDYGIVFKLPSVGIIFNYVEKIMPLMVLYLIVIKNNPDNDELE